MVDKYARYDLGITHMTSSTLCKADLVSCGKVRYSRCFDFFFFWGGVVAHPFLSHSSCLFLSHGPLTYDFLRKLCRQKIRRCVVLDFK